MKEKEIRKIIKALDQISLGVNTIKAALKCSLNDEGDAVRNAGLVDDSASFGNKVDISENIAGSAQSADGFLDVLDLSGDIKKVQLALIRMGKGTAADVAKVVSLEVDEVKIYLKTLMRDSAILAISSKDSETVYRTVLKKKGKKASKGAASLLDKLL